MTNILESMENYDSRPLCGMTSGQTTSIPVIIDRVYKCHIVDSSIFPSVVYQKIHFADRRPVLNTLVLFRLSARFT